MNINFAPVDAKFIADAVENGEYSNATELVRDAVRQLRKNSGNRHDRLAAALEEGMADVRAGRVVEYTPELMDQILKEAIQHAAEGREPNPDVCP